LKEYTVPFVQLDPLKTILVFSHEHNTFDKREMLDNPHPDYLKTSNKTVDTFIHRANEGPIKDFFMNQIDKLLENYEPGLPKMKPDVLEQIKKIEAERAEMMRKAQEQQYQPIILQQPGKDPVTLSQQDIVTLIQQQQQGLQQQQQTISEMQNVLQQAQMTMNILSTENSELKNQIASSSEDKNTNKELTQLQDLVIQLQTQLIEKTRENKSLIATKEEELQSVRDEIQETVIRLHMELTQLQELVIQLQSQLIERRRENKTLVDTKEEELQSVRDEMQETINRLQMELESEKKRSVEPASIPLTTPIISVPSKTEPEVKIFVNE
jgi:myosin heavy subunit